MIRPPEVTEQARRRAAALVVGVGCALLSGCVEIPSDGLVVDGQRVEGGRNAWIQVFPAGPSSKARPGELVREFLRACADPTNDHEVARRFLAGEERLTWRPDSPIVVYSGGSLTVTVTRNGVSQVDPGPTVVPSVSTSRSTPSSVSRQSASPRGVPPTATPSSGATPSSFGSIFSAPPTLGEHVRVSVQAKVLARIDRSGHYTLAGPRETETRFFALSGTSMGWRIAGLDQGMMITRDELNRTFRAMPLYFADPMGDYLVPDVRWFPATTSTPSQAVSALLAGPQDWLASAVVSGAPAGTRLTVNGVKIVDGVATVDLTKQAWDADARQRLMLRTQLEHTLASIGVPNPQVTAVVITVEQQKFELQPPAGASAAGRVPREVRPGAGADGTGSTRLHTPPPIDPQPVVLDSRGAIARLGLAVEPVAGLEALAGPGTSDPATDAGGEAYAVLTANRTRLLHAVPSRRPTTLVVGQALVAPSFDPFGWVWTTQENCRGVLLAGRPGLGVSRVNAKWLDRWRVSSVRISREGARAVVVAQSPDGGPQQVFVSSIIRNTRATPMALAPPTRLLEDAAETTGAAWMDATHIVVLARRPAWPTMPWVVEIGGDAHETVPVQAVAITAGNSESQLYVQLATGSVRTRVGSTWIDVPGVRYPSMPG